MAEVDMVSESFNAVDFLLENSIDDLSLEQKVKLKDKLPTPGLNLVRKFGRGTRSFQPDWYNKHPWLCGSAKRKTMHCYCCLMFSGDEPWSKKGVSNVINFEIKARKHSISRNHLKHSEAFHFLGRDKISCDLLPESSAEICKHNERVGHNRRVVYRLIDVICHLSRQQLLRDSIETGSYLETLQLLATEEPLIKEHLDTCLLSTETMTATRDDLINSISAVVSLAISNEISKAKFVSIQIDEISDACCESGITVIVRYHDGMRAVERFLGFFDIPLEGSAEGIARVIEGVLMDYDMKEKLVSQTYDGVCLKAGDLKSVHAIIQESYTQAILLHSCSHDLNMLLLHCGKSIKDVKLFICNLTAFQRFFNDSTPRYEFLVREGFNVPNFVQTVCDIHVLKSIKLNYDVIRKAVIHVSQSEDWDPESINLASGIRRILESPSFSFYLCFYCGIFESIEVFSNVLQGITVIGIEACLEHIKKLKSIFSSLRSEGFIKRCLRESSNINRSFVLTEKPKIEVLQDILDSIYRQIDVRFNNFEKIGFVELLNRANFKDYAQSFPYNQLEKLQKMCAKSFNFIALQNELMNIYENADMFYSHTELFAYIQENRLEDIYEQTTRLLELIFTMPLSPVSSESAIKRVKAYLRGCMENKRLAPAAILTIEKDFVQTCMEDFCLKNQIVDVFSLSFGTLRPELIYKNVYSV